MHIVSAKILGLVPLLQHIVADTSITFRKNTFNNILKFIQRFRYSTVRTMRDRDPSENILKPQRGISR